MYIIGGWNKSRHLNDRSCYTYDIIENKRIKIADLNVARRYVACTVFEGKIVVTGGYFNNRELKSVEAYDYYENKWKFLPDMINYRSDHATVSMGNKLFVIGGYYTKSCEVFDSYVRKFTKIRSGIIVSCIENWHSDAVSIGNYIVVFHSLLNYTETVIYLFDIYEKKWSTIKCDFTKNLLHSNFAKYYAKN